MFNITRVSTIVPYLYLGLNVKYEGSQVKVRPTMIKMDSMYK